jgi:hypothetical protein
MILAVHLYDTLEQLRRFPESTHRLIAVGKNIPRSTGTQFIL